MATIIKPPYFESAVNAGEKRLLDFLEVNLPDNYYLIPNIEIGSTNPKNNLTKYWEYDLIVIAPHGIYNIENKDWHGRIEGDDNYWYLNDRQRPNPLKSCRLKSSIMASKLKTENYDFGKAWVQTMVTLSYNNPYPPIISTEAYRMTFQLDKRLIDYIKNPEEIGKEENEIADIQKEIVSYLTGQQSKKSPDEKKEVLNYEILEILQQDTNYTEYLVKPKGVTEVRRRIKEYALQVTNLSPQELEKREEKIKNQYKALNKLKAKPFILNVEFQMDEENHLFYEVSDFLDENSLRSEIKFKTFTFQEKVRIIQNVMEALKAAHQEAVFHRDINPDNIYLNSGYAYLGNFGKSYFIDHNEEGYTVMPTLDENNATAYHPLELIANDVSELSDIYSIGVLIYWLFTEKEPFKTPYELDKIGGKLPKKLLPTSVQPNLPKWIDEVCEKTILTLDTDRIESIEALQELIEEGIKGNSSSVQEEIKPEPEPTVPTFDELKEGDSIGVYSIHKVLGKGGYSKVFKVKHRLQNQYYTLKLFNESVNIASVKDEYEALKNLDHPNIVKFIWNDLSPSGQFFTVMEYLAGENLSIYTRTDAKLPIHKVYQVGKEILSALVEMQAKEPAILHRDIKPQNIIWDKSERFVLIDFNVASNDENDKNFVGTNPYLAPDLIQDNYKVHWNKSADTFSLGVTLYELLCKQHPWHPGKMPLVSKAPNNPKEIEPRITDAFSDFLLKAIATKKEERFIDAQEMLHALTEIEDIILEENEVSVSSISNRTKLYHTEIIIYQDNTKIKLYDKMHSYVDLNESIVNVLERFKDNLKNYKPDLNKKIGLQLTIDSMIIIKEYFWMGGAKSYTEGNINRVYSSLKLIFEENKDKITAHKVDIEGLSILDYINSLYSQSKYGNFGTRVGLETQGFDELTYTPTKLDKSLIPAIVDGKFKLLIITGNAGDGKTAFIKKIEENGAVHDIEHFEHSNGARFKINSTVYESNYDGSQDEDGKINNDVLEKFFKPFEDISDYSKAEEGRIIAINEGRLVEFLTTSEKHRHLAKLIEDYFYEEGHTKLPDGLMIINLNLRSVVAAEDGEESLFKQQIKALTQKELWQNAEIPEDSFIRYNVDTLNDSAAGENIINRLEWLLRTVSLKRELHITMRDIRSFISFLITRDVSLEDLSEVEKLKETDPEKYWQYYYFNITNPNANDGGNNDRLIKLLRETDIGEVSIPNWDRELFFSEHHEKDFIEFSERKLNLFEDFNRHKEFIPAHEQNPENILRIRERHKTFVRHHYFEGKAEWINENENKEPKPSYLLRVPYQSIFEFTAILKNSEISEKTKQTISRAVSLNEGSNNEALENKFLMLSSGVKDYRGKSFKMFPLDNFELMVNRTDHLTKYLEYEPDSLTFREKNQKHIKLSISLDLYEMLYFIKKGYSPSLNDLRGKFIELTVFKNLLENLNYNEVVVTSDDRIYYSIQKSENNRIKIQKISE